MTLSFSLRYTLAWVVAAAGVVAGVIAGAILVPFHPSWLTQDVAATAGIVSAVCVGLSALLPQVQRTPQAREDAYANAAMGVMPDDITATIAARAKGGDPQAT